VAAVLGRADEAQRCRTQVNEIRPLIHAAFYDEQKQRYVLDEQSCQVMPLMTGIVPEALRGRIRRKLEDNISLKNSGHLDTGMLGTYFLIQYLQETGRNDLIHAIMNQTSYPGWGYMLSQGATTFWEQWNGYWSQIHSCFTSPGGWFYQGLAGIQPDETAAGFKKIIIKPAIVGDLQWVNAHYDSIHGRIISEWKRESNLFKINLAIPPNTTATLFLPAKDAAAVLESGQPAARAKGVKFLRMEPDQAVFVVGSGSYSFVSPVRSSPGIN
jgi:alpha-L-rhamnosidase